MPSAKARSGGGSRSRRSYSRAKLDYFGAALTAYDRLLTVGPSTFLIEGAIDRANVGEEVLDGGYRPAGTRDDYDVYGRRDGRRTLAVTDGRVLFSLRGPEADGIERIRTVLRARHGDVGRYHEVDDDFATVSETLGARPWTWHQPRPIRNDAREDGDLDGLDRTSTSFVATEAAVYFVEAYLYERESALDESALKAYLRGRSRAQNTRTTGVSVRGRVALVRMQLPIDDWTRQADAERETAPHTTWIPESVDGGVRFHHEGGDTVDAAHLATPVDPDFASGFETVGPGDAPRAEADDDETVQLFYETDGGDSRQVIASYEPEDRT